MSVLLCRYSSKNAESIANQCKRIPTERTINTEMENLLKIADNKEINGRLCYMFMHMPKTRTMLLYEKNSERLQIEKSHSMILFFIFVANKIHFLYYNKAVILI